MVNLFRARRATQLLFLVCGLGISSWAPMVPYVKDRLQLDEAQLGLLLLFLGTGALVVMPITGVLISKYGCRRVVAVAVCVMALVLPALLVMHAVVIMAILLLLFGAAAGTIDIAMNAHGLQVQQLSGKKMLSSLHGLYSVGGLAGPLLYGLLIKVGLQPLFAAVGIAGLLVIILLSQYRFLLSDQDEKQISTTETQVSKSRYSWLHGSVIFLGMLCFCAFLAEGAMLDWSAVFLRDTKGIPPEFGGAGYAAFSIAMAVMRLLGDGLIERFDSKTIVSGGSVLAAAGLILAISSPWMYSVLAGFILLGIGAANMVPVFFSDAGNLRNVSVAVAIPAIGTMGYAGQLAGPAILGFVAHYISIAAAFGGCAVLFMFMAVAYMGRRKFQL